MTGDQAKTAVPLETGVDIQIMWRDGKRPVVQGVRHLPTGQIRPLRIPEAMMLLARLASAFIDEIDQASAEPESNILLARKGMMG